MGWWRSRSCRRMFEFLLRPIFSSPTSSKVISHSTPSSSSSLISSSHREVRPIHTVIIQRNLITDFLEATSLPVNAPIHRSREASCPGTPMRTELSRCEKDLPVRLARRLSLPHSNLSTSKGSRDDQEMVFTLEIVIE